MMKAVLLDLPSMVQRPASESTKVLLQRQETFTVGEILETTLSSNLVETVMVGEMIRQAPLLQ